MHTKDSGSLICIQVSQQNIQTTHQTYLCHNHPVVDLIKDVHSDLVLTADLQYPVVAWSNAES